MQEQTTYPALLSNETIPVPLGLGLAPAVQAPPEAKRDWLRPVLLVVAVLAVAWVLKRWW